MRFKRKQHQQQQQQQKNDSFRVVGFESGGSFLSVIGRDGLDGNESSRTSE